MTLFRRLVLTWLAAVMVLTSGAMAAVRSAPDGQSIVICTGTEIAVIQIDHNGKPIDPLPVCPDCVLFKATLAPPLAFAVAPLSSTLKRHLQQSISLRVATDVITEARGPPIHI
ncbi:MAG: hypothetical protein AAGA08_17655 [Pseudomonadota bacterium]